jgi:NAD(P)-dependent dehydrogenase (short-subunit alcohol dehydrogenase family)
MRELTDKVAVVTGAASGIGRAVAVLLAEKGCHVALVDVQEGPLAETAALVSAKGRKTSQHLVDVSDRAAVSELPEAVLAQHGCVDVLVNNAGIASGYTFEDHPIEHFERLIGVNFYGVVYGCKYFLPHLKQRPEAHIVNISSMFGIFAFPTQAAYSASKFAVRGFSQVLWVELAASPVRVTCVYPGGVQTNLVRASPGWAHGTEVHQQQFEQVVRRTPEAAARRIVRAIERNKPNLRLGVETYVIDWIKRLFPDAPHRLMASARRREARKKAASAP